MKVKAIATGYYGEQLKPEGSVFELIPYKADKPLYNDEGKPVFEKGTKVQKIEKDHVFTAEEQFSSKWMEKVDKGLVGGVMPDKISKTPLKDEKAGKPLPAQHGEIPQKSDLDVI